MASTYLLGKQIGKGGFGTVYAATKISTGENVAIKVIDLSSIKNPKQRERKLQEIMNEIAILLRIKNKDGCKRLLCIIDYFTIKSGKTDEVWIVTELLGNEWESGTHATRESDESKLTIIVNIVHALKFLHSLGIAHRDLKLDNFMYNSDTKEIKLLDYGMACSIQPDFDSRIKECGRSIGGTPGYLCPELVQAYLDKRYDDINNIDRMKCDIFSLGVLIFYIIEKKPLYRRTDEKTPSSKLMSSLRNARRQFEDEENAEKYGELVYSLTAENPEDRPDLDDVIEQLEDISTL